VIGIGCGSSRSAGNKQWRATAVHDAGAIFCDSRHARSVLECASPLALSNGTANDTKSANDFNQEKALSKIGKKMKPRDLGGYGI
jgi:hypothetical protein